MPILVVVLVVALVGVGIAGGRLVSGQTPTASTPASAQPSRPSVPPPWPSGAAVVPYDAVFTGDATGVTDVTDELKTFLESHDGQHVALAVEGAYSVTQLSFTASDLTVDFRGSRIEGSQKGVYGILVIQASSQIVLNDPSVVGTGFEWVGDGSNPSQWEHGIEIEGGSDITLNNPKTRDTLGDGVYVGFQAGMSQPPVGVVINNPNIERASRNGISPVAGEVTILGGHIAHTGLFGIDFEPNNDEGATSIRGVVDGVDIRNYGELPTGLYSYALAAAGYSTATKPSMLVQNVTGDILRMTIRNTASVTVRNNVSDTATVADFPGSSSITFTDNVRITRE